MTQTAAGLSGNQKRKMKSAARLYAVQALFQMEQSGQTVEQIEKDSDRDRWFTAEEAREYGLIDFVYSTDADAPGKKGSAK